MLSRIDDRPGRAGEDDLDLLDAALRELAAGGVAAAGVARLVTLARFVVEDEHDRQIRVRACDLAGELDLRRRRLRELYARERRVDRDDDAAVVAEGRERAFFRELGEERVGRAAVRLLRDAAPRLAEHGQAGCARARRGVDRRGPRLRVEELLRVGDAAVGRGETLRVGGEHPRGDAEEACLGDDRAGGVEAGRLAGRVGGVRLRGRERVARDLDLRLERGDLGRGTELLLVELLEVGLRGRELGLRIVAELQRARGASVDERAPVRGDRLLTEDLRAARVSSLIRALCVPTEPFGLGEGSGREGGGVLRLRRLGGGGGIGQDGGARANGAAPERAGTGDRERRGAEERAHFFAFFPPLLFAALSRGAAVGGLLDASSCARRSSASARPRREIVSSTSARWRSACARVVSTFCWSVAASPSAFAAARTSRAVSAQSRARASSCSAWCASPASRAPCARSSARRDEASASRAAGAAASCSTAAITRSVSARSPSARAIAEPNVPATARAKIARFIPAGTPRWAGHVKEGKTERMSKVAIVQGGPSSEAEVSRASAAAVAAALAARGHVVTRLELDPSIAGALAAGGYDVVFPVVHGALGEDGALQGLLEIASLPYVGSGVLASALAMDKIAAKRAFRALGLPIAAEHVVHRGDAPLVAARAVRAALGPAVVVKPSAQGSAIGVERLAPSATDDELAAALDRAFAFDDVVLCERFVVGRELTCGVTDVAALGGPRALPPTEILAKKAEFYDFASKYAPGGSAHVCPANVGKEVTARVQELALAAHRALGCRDLSRTDFIVPPSGDVVLLEVNTMPGMTATSLYPEAMAATGHDFATMCDALLRAALARRARRPVPIPAMP